MLRWSVFMENGATSTYFTRNLPKHLHLYVKLMLDGPHQGARVQNTINRPKTGPKTIKNAFPDLVKNNQYLIWCAIHCVYFWLFLVPIWLFSAPGLPGQKTIKWVPKTIKNKHKVSHTISNIDCFWPNLEMHFWLFWDLFLVCWLCLGPLAP